MHAGSHDKHDHQEVLVCVCVCVCACVWVGGCMRACVDEKERESMCVYGDLSPITLVKQLISSYLNIKAKRA